MWGNSSVHIGCSILGYRRWKLIVIESPCTRFLSISLCSNIAQNSHVHGILQFQHPFLYPSLGHQEQHSSCFFLQCYSNSWISFHHLLQIENASLATLSVLLNQHLFLSLQLHWPPQSHLVYLYTRAASSGFSCFCKSHSYLHSGETKATTRDHKQP